MSSPPESVDSVARAAEHDRRAAGASTGGAATDVLLQVGARGLNTLLGVGVTIALVRGLGTQGFGEWSTLLSIVTVVGYLGSLGLNEVAVRHAAMDPEQESVWVSALVSLQLILSVPVTIITLVVGVAIVRGGSTRVAAVLLSLTCLLGALGSVRTVFQLRIRNSWSAAFELANGLMWAVAVFAIVALGGGIVAFAAAFLASMGTVNVVQFVVARRQLHFGVTGGGRARRELMVVGVPFAIASVLYLAYTQIDQVLVFQLAGARAAGLYGAADRVLERALVVPASILATMFPMIAAAYGQDLARMRELVQTAAEVLLSATVPFVCLVAVIARPLMRLLFGAQFAPAGPALTILSIVFAISAFSFVAGDLVIVLRLQRRYIAYASTGLIVNVVLNLVLIPRYGFLAAAWVALVTEAVVIGLALRTALRAVGQRIRFARILRIALLSAAGGFAALAARRLGLPLLAIVGVWLIATIGAWPIVRPWTVSELRGLLRERQT